MCIQKCTHKIEGWRYGFTAGYIVTDYEYNPATDKKDIKKYYNGGMDYGARSKIFSDTIETARFYSDIKSAETSCKILQINVAGYPSIWPSVEKAHVEFY